MYAIQRQWFWHEKFVSRQMEVVSSCIQVFQTNFIKVSQIRKQFCFLVETSCIFFAYKGIAIMAISVGFLFSFGSTLVYKDKRKMLQQGTALQSSLSNQKQSFLES